MADNLYKGYTPEQWQEFGKYGGTLDNNYGIKNAVGTDVGAGLYAKSGLQTAGEFKADQASANMNTDGGFGGLGGLAGIGQIAGGLGALGSAWTGYKALGLAEDQFGFEKAATNRNIANQGLLANNAITNANEVGLALGGGAMTPDQIAASKAATQAKLVDTSAIG